MDRETGYTYNEQRYLCTDYGIWTGVGPLVDKYFSISPYAYCNWNPLKCVDPDGKGPKEAIKNLPQDISMFVQLSFGLQAALSIDKIGLEVNAGSVNFYPGTEHDIKNPTMSQSASVGGGAVSVSYQQEASYEEDQNPQKQETSAINIGIPQTPIYVSAEHTKTERYTKNGNIKTSQKSEYNLVTGFKSFCLKIKALIGIEVRIILDVEKFHEDWNNTNNTNNT